MKDFPELAALGPRILIMGPSNSGKSILAVAIATRLEIVPVHLDQLHHLPNTNWQPRPEAEFVALQRAAIARDRWVIDGNYSQLLPERLARATGAIVLDDNPWRRLGRYVRRTLFERDRAGTIEGDKDRLKLSMLHWVLLGSRHNGARYRALVNQTQLPHVFCYTMGEVQRLYMHWRLQDRKNA